MLGVMEVSEKGARKTMKKWTTVGLIAVVAGVLLATVTSVSANHAATGKGTYAVGPHVLSGFNFVVALERTSSEKGLNFVQSEMTRIRGPMSFQTFMVSTTIDPITIPPEPAERMVTITGELVSTTFLRVGEERQPFAELVHFIAIGVDKVTPEAGDDHFSLTVEYSAKGKQGPLFASLGFGVCDATTCTITFDGPVKTGDIFVHTSGGD
jgi:hypothetical protein